MSRATNSERSPLLRLQSRQSDAPSFSVANVAPSTFQITSTCLLLVAAHLVASLLATAAAVSLNQAAACRNIYGRVPDPTNDAHCDDPALFSELSRLLSVEAILTTVASIFAPIPIGVAADRYGRRPFLVLALVGSVLKIGSRLFICLFELFRSVVFPLRLIWLSTSFELFTGGGAAFFAIIYTILTDVTSKAQRSTIFFYLAAGSILTAQIGHKLRDFINDNLGPWAALFTAFGLFVFAILCAFCMPETICLNKSVYNEEAIEDEPGTHTTTEKMRAAMSAACKQLTASMAALFCRNKTLAILLLAVFVMGLKAHSMAMLPFYIDHRYKLAGKTFPTEAVRNWYLFLLNALLLPLAAQALLHFEFPALRKDATLARWGVLAAALGLLGIGLAPNIGALTAALVVYALVSAYTGGIMGLLSQLTGEDHLAAMFATTGVLATLGSLLGQPLFSVLFQSASNLGKTWSGLPYIVVGSTYIIVAVVVFVVTAGTAREADDNEQG
ncbi:hypothetical protein LLEC1_07664 [Akanthomyces lecanii]|uniref:Major facilitator superfamily (MFS) profile domain-containing protein n=1 Tax=Cordyceps confragosa TaxID=2714763 RepID=A0A179ITE8_CORDF|nr:hypothetical protein LLEC1_07664 [Akanthomyces lecanii]